MNKSLPSCSPGSSSDQLDELIAEYVKAKERGERPDPQQFAQKSPEHAAEFLAFVSNDQVVVSHVDEALTDLPAADLPDTFGPFEVLQVLGEGAMGRVYKVRHQELHRVEALKVIRSHPSADSLKRFRTEAEAAASLSDPGIVQVYDSGELQGIHYIRMEFVQGESLKDAVASRPIPPQRAAEIIRDVARSVHHAHQKGVVHRDLKPANILMELPPGGRPAEAKSAAETKPATAGLSDTLRLGRPRVADFGLAKLLHAETTLTLAQHILGTPWYMSPEQAQGSTTDVGPLSDVYSLGVILYELLTGRVPFNSVNRDVVLNQVKHDEPVAPRQLDPSLPRDLETICLKCLEKSPSSRYASGQELAEELARFLAGEAIVARPKSALRRVWDWSFRHPAKALALAVFPIIALISTTFAVYAHRLRLAAEQSEQRAKASDEKAAELARQLNKLSRELVPVESSRAVQREVETTLQRYSAEFLKQAANDPQWQGIRAESLQRLANFEMNSLAPAESEKLLKEAISLQEQRLAADPGNLRYETDLNVSRNNLFACLNELGRSEEARRVITKCLESRQRLLEKNPADFETRRNLALTQGNYGHWLMKQGKLDEGIALIRTAQTTQRQLAHGPEIALTKPRVMEELGLTCLNLGSLLPPAESKEALANYREARTLFQQLSTAHPATMEYQRNLAKVHFSIANALHKQGATFGITSAIVDADRASAKLVQAQPDVLENWLWQVRINHLHGVIYLSNKDATNSLGALNQARRLCDARLLKADPTNQQFRELSSQIDGSLYEVLLATGKLKEAEAAALRAVETLISLAKDHPQNLDYLAALAYAHQRTAITAFAQDRIDDALDRISTSLALTNKLMQLQPSSKRLHQLKVALFGVSGQINIKANRYPAVRQAMTDLFQAAQDAMKQFPDEPEFRFHAALGLNDHGMSYVVADEPEKALPLFDQGLTLLHETPAAHKSLPDFIEQNTRLLANRAEALCALKRPAEAIPPIVEFLPNIKSDGGAAHALVLALANCVPLLPESDRPAATQQALAALKQAIAAGYHDANSLRDDPALAPLRALPEFEKLIRSIKP